MSESFCDMCKGDGKNQFNEVCPYCNGTGEWNDAASAYLKNHICQCITLDRKFCPVCEKKCHHDSSQTPKQRIEPGYGGMTATISVTSSITDVTMDQDKEILVVS